MMAPLRPLRRYPRWRRTITSIKPGGTMDGKGVTAEQSPSPGDNGEHSETHARGDEFTSARGANSPASGNEQGVPTPSSPEGQAPRNPWGVPDEKASEWQQPRVRVDAR